MHIVGDVGHNIPQICEDVGHRQVDHMASIIEMDGNIYDQVVSILIDPRSNYSYISPNLVDKCALTKVVHEKYWLVQLATDMKKRVHHSVKTCA